MNVCSAAVSRVRTYTIHWGRVWLTTGATLVLFADWGKLPGPVTCYLTFDRRHTVSPHSCSQCVVRSHKAWSVSSLHWNGYVILPKFRNWLPGKLSFWQLPVHPWRKFRQNDISFIVWKCNDIRWLYRRQTWWRHEMETFSALLGICAGNSPVTVDVELWCFLWSAFLICVRIYGWVNNREAGDSMRYRAHYDFTAMN